MMSTERPVIQISATFTAEPVGEGLAFWLGELGIEAEIRFSGYQQVLQQALDPASESAMNRGGFNVFLIRPEDLANGGQVSEVFGEVEEALIGLAGRNPATQLVLYAPHRDRVAETTGRESESVRRLGAVSNIDALTTEEWTSLYPVADPHDAESERSAGIPYTETQFAALATMLARRIGAHLRPPAKVLALDADHTLWRGVCGEDGPEALGMDGPWRAVREFARSCRERGVLLCLCSKNSEADVDRVFARRSEDLGLTREDFTGWRVNWLPKSENLASLARELNLGIGSFVFLDDNPAEVAEVTANCPGITALTLPADTGEIPAFLQHLWSLDRARMTTEDAARAEFYRQESERRRLGESAPSFADFLAGLRLRIDIEEISEGDLARVSQLTLRTNQFNANSLRLSESELRDWLATGRRGYAVRVTDRFGDYGLVGAMFPGIAAGGGVLAVDGFLLSCRAMGKGVERAMVQSLAAKALDLGAGRLRFAFADTDRNEPCRRFFEMIGAERVSDGGDFELEARLAADLPLIPIEAAPSGAVGAAGVGESGKRPGLTSQLAEMIAGDLRSPGNLVARLRAAGSRPRPEISQAYVRPGREIEKRIADIWREILKLETVGVEDPFAALGGTSLQMVRLHAALRREFDAPIALAELFELPTITAIARRLEGGREQVTGQAAEVGLSEVSDAVAIVGLALRVPGADNPETFWDNLAAGVVSLSRFERDEIDNPEDFDKPDFVPVKGIIDGVDQFDASFFGILPKDAKIMDPQQRIFLELAWEAMERAGYAPDTTRDRVGVYAGAYFDSYLLANLCTDREFLADLIPSIQVGSLQTELGNDKDYLATRVAFKLNLRGPAMTLQTACSTSMVAIVEACRAIRSGLCDMALAGGVTVTLPLRRGYHYTEQGMLSGDGDCRAFDEKASGTVFGNGAGVVVLKRLSDAIRDRDHIHAVIRGSGLNNDGGVKHSYTAPSVEGQADVIRMAHRDAGIDPRTVTYIEAHGTGTPLGDPIEVTALTKAFRASGMEERQTCAIGSLKPNIGHLDVASGVCGVIKTALSLERAMLPPLPHFQKPNPKIDFANSPFYVNTALTPWKPGAEGQPRRAGVSSFGVGGTNAHVVVEEAPVIESGPSTRSAQLFLLSARTDTALEKAGGRLAEHTGNAPGTLTPADVAWTLSVGRKPFRCRRAVVAENFADLASRLASGAGVTGVADRSNPPVNFLFPGQGAQHVGMARDFYEAEPRFRVLVDHCSALLRPHLGLDLTDVLFPPEGVDAEAAADRLKHTVLAQPAIFVVEYAMADLWRHWGVEPTAMIGHSVGEFVAACQAGVFGLEDGLRLLAERGRLMGELPGGGMLSVRLPAAELIRRMPDTLDLAAVNGPSLCVVAGPRERLTAFAAELEADGVIAKELHTSHAFHSRMMDAVIDRFADCFAGIELRAPSLPILSTVTGEWLTEAEATDPRYWAKHLRETVRFHDAVVSIGNDQPEQIFLEVGPGQTLAGLARQSLDRKAGHVTVATCRHVKEPGSDHANALESLGRLWVEGVGINWENFYSHEARKRVVLPGYPFERKRHWVDPTPLNAVGTPGVPVPALAEQSISTFVVEPPMPSQAVMSIPDTPSRADNLGNAVRGILTELSGIPGDEMPGSSTFLELGFDSLLLTQASKALQDEFQTEITLRQLMSDLASIDAMVTHLDAVLPAERFRPEAAPAPVAAPVSTPIPAAAPAPVSPAASPVAMTIPTSGGAMEALVSQQLELMRQQIALLQGAPATVPASLPAPVTTPAPVPSPAPAPKPVSTPASAPAPASDVSAPSTTISRDAETLTDQQQRHLDELIAKYIGKTRTSKELTAKYRQWYADPRTVSGFNRNWKEMIYQIAVKKSKGSRLLDIDGNEYIDLLNGFGPNFLGHSPDFVTKALHEQLDRGVEVGPQSVTAMEAAKLFCEITGNERASFVNTGSEAVQAAMRLARTVTGRDKIVVFTKDYHGNFDEMLVRSVGEGDRRRSLPIAPGIPFRAVEDVIVLPYGTDEALEVIRDRAHELAAVIVEPIQSRRPEFQPKEFIREVRSITEKSGTVFVFDEVITGFRTGPHGAQEFYGVKADIATYGKVIGGGMPIGVVAGKAEYMDTFDGGMWQYGDDSFPEKGVTFFAGTFVRHPLAMAATKQVLLFLRDQTPEFWSTVRERANRLAGSVDRMFQENEAPFRMPNFGSQMFVRAEEGHKYANLLFFHLRQKGVFLLEGFPTYMTAAHSDEDVDYVIDAFSESVAELQEGGFFTRPAGMGETRLNGSRLMGPPRQLAEEQTTPPVGDEVEERESRVYPMTEPLREVWLASQVNENASLCFNEVNTLTFRGQLDEGALRGAIQELVNRHEGLRTVFLPDGEGFRVRPSLEIGIEVRDHREMSAEDRRLALEEMLATEQSTRFDLERGPLFRALLVREGDKEHTLILNAHHLACDGWSFNVVTDELSRLYATRVAGGGNGLGEPEAQFGRYAAETAWGESRNDAGKGESFWLSRFADPVPPLALPVDRPPLEEPDFRCDTLAERLDAETTRALKRVAGESGATLFALLMGAYQTLLHRLSRQRRLAVAFPVAGQNRDGLRGMVGHCVNFLPFVSDLDPAQPFSGFVADVQGRLLDALEHQDYTYGRLIRKLDLSRDGGGSPLVEAVFNLERMDGFGEFPGLETAVAEVDRRYSGNPLFLKVVESKDGLELRFDFQTSRYSAETVRHWLASLRAILEAVIATPSASLAELGASMAGWQRDLLDSWNATANDYPRQQTISGLFDEMASTRPEATAIRSEGREISYRELAEMSDRVAAGLGASAADPMARVGLFMDRSPEMIAAILAVLKRGAAYVPIDPEYPAERIEYLIHDSGVRAVVSDSGLADRLPRRVDVLDIGALLETNSSGATAGASSYGAESPACVFYTSGSTGRPKGAVIPHRAVVRLVKDSTLCELGPDVVTLHVASVCFDAAVFEIYAALLNGGTVVLPPRGGPAGLDTIRQCLQEQGVTTLWLTSGLFQLMVEENLAALGGLRHLLTGGDVVSPTHAARALEIHPGLRLINGYGPTENTTFTTCHHITRDDLDGRPLPVGRPLPNNTVWILDEAGRPLAPGIPGELCCGGDGLALEYLNHPELTAERFIPDPFSREPGARLYRTGDLCRHRADGVIEFLGRMDHQIKIRGFRVELGEVEARLLEHPKVRQARVLAPGEDALGRRLVAYVSPVPRQTVEVAELGDFLRSKMPAHMVPSAFVILDELPINRNGKIDRAALPNPDEATDPEVAGERDAIDTPTPTEEAITGMWRDILRVREVGLDDDFFRMGGHSLLGMRLFARLQRTFEVSLPLATLFKAPTIRQLSRVIDSRLAAHHAPMSQEQSPAREASRRSGGIHLVGAKDVPMEEIAETTVAIQPKGDLPPLFAVHGGDGGILFYGNLAERLGERQPFYAFEAPALTADGPIPEEPVEETAARYLEEMRKVQAEGPYHLCGYSFGGVVAYEMACLLRESGEEVEFLGLVDTSNPAAEARKLSLSERVAVNWTQRNSPNAGVLERVGKLGKRVGSGLAYRLYFEAEGAMARTLPAAKSASWLRQVQLRNAHERAMDAFVPRHFDGRLTLFRAMVGNDKFDIGEHYGWDGMVDEMEIIDVPGNHVTIFDKRNIEGVATAFRKALGAPVSAEQPLMAL